MNGPLQLDSDSRALHPMLMHRVLSLYARGLSIDEIHEHLRNNYRLDMPLPLLRSATAPILDEYHAWQNETLPGVYPVVYFDSLEVRVRDSAQVNTHVLMYALGIDMEGFKKPLGLWLARTETAVAWERALRHLAQRGLSDPFVASVHAQAGLREALQNVYPQTGVLRCLVRAIDSSLRLVAWRDRKAATDALRQIFSMQNALDAADARQRFQNEWGARYPGVGYLCESQWDELTAIFTLPDPLRRAILRTNAIQTLQHRLRKVTHRHGIFSNEESVLMRTYLAQRELARRWGQPLRHWKDVLNSLVVRYRARTDC